MSLHHRTVRVLAVLAMTSLTLGIGGGAAHALSVGPRAATPEFQQPDLPVLPPIDVDPCVILPQLCTPDTTVPPSPTTTVPTTDTTAPTPTTTVPHDDTTPTGDPAPMAPAPHTVVTGSPHFTG